jgi:hypothetical protein
VLLLVSDDFLASEFVMNEEVPKLLAAAEAEGVTVLPLDQYLVELDMPRQQRALKTIAECIRDALQKPGPKAKPPAVPGLVPHSFHLETARIVAEGQGWEVQRQPLQLEGLLDDLGDGVSLPLLRIPAVEFVMGSPEAEPDRSGCEGPQHRVRLQEFWIGQTPITQAQWRAVMGTNPSRFADQPDSAQRPVEQVSWREAMAFCRPLAERTGRAYTLPSEAE